MSNLAKLEFVALDITGKNYLSWVLDAEMHLDANDLGDAIKEGNTASNQIKAKAMIFLRHHLHEALKVEYLTIKDPLVLWKNLKERITSQLKLCGENVSDADMLEKTFSTFHASNVVLQQQYRERGFTKYSELISCLLVAEQNNELLMKNHESRPTGSAPFPEANIRGRGRGRGNGHRRDHGRVPINNSSHQKWKNNGENERNKGGQNNRHVESSCLRCGGKGHWVRTCRTPRHLVNLYQEHIRNKGKKIETNLLEENEDDLTHLDVADFFDDPNGRIDHLIGDGNVYK
ncbi:uncharacterized protein LOC130744594 [Lotus japonicus]|uniref:uncharacterized protein LOC130744594 n=1 Tax=Lotus japonicus TaxID=34305 RepID=UPI0025909E96|nr:uncharacterized protein LOC130744594 [Lotus japonicus]